MHDLTWCLLDNAAKFGVEHSLLVANQYTFDPALYHQTAPQSVGAKRRYGMPGPLIEVTIIQFSYECATWFLSGHGGEVVKR